MIVRRALKNSTVVPGGGAIDVCLSGGQLVNIDGSVVHRILC
jgi:hypothetical protein